MKKSIKLIISMIIGMVLGAYMMVSYALSFNSEEISYDTSTSGAVQANVKDALDFLYNKTKSGASTECPENMSCVEKPGVTLNVSGPGTVDKGTVYVGLNESNTFKVKGDNTNSVLYSISCTNGYTVTGFNTMKTDEQEVIITNPNTANNSVCTITYGPAEMSVSSGIDSCSSNSSGCLCYQMKYNITNFTYGSHTGCNFKSKTCKDVSYGRTFDCASLYWDGICWRDNTSIHYSAICSGVITCAT